MSNRQWMQWILPPAVLAVGILVAVILVIAKPKARLQATPTPAPLVRVVVAQPQSIQLVVEAHGTVAPLTQIDLVPEVSGRAVEVSPSMKVGGFFAQGEVLVRIDPRDYELAVARAGAALAQAEVRLSTEKAEAEVALKEWTALGTGPAPALVARKPQLAEATASLQAAGADLAQAELDLSRTSLLAPFAGRVRSESVDTSQFVTRGVSLAQIYSVDFAEVRLPISDEDLAYVDLPLNGPGDRRSDTMVSVSLSTRFAGRLHSWDGTIVRTEAELDPHSRMVHAVARVAAPYAHTTDAGRPPLSVGMFVNAQIRGRTLPAVFSVPRTAIRAEDRVFVVDDEGRLRFRDVDIVRRQREDVIIRSGLSQGERICISPLEVAVDGMPVRAMDSAGDNVRTDASAGSPDSAP